MTTNLQQILDWALNEHKNGRSQATSPETLLEDLNFPTHVIDLYSDDAEVVFEVDLVSWLCTDTHVGWSVQFFDGMPAAFLYKPFRKSEYTVDWISTANTRNIQQLVFSWALNRLKDTIQLQEPVWLGESVTLEAVTDTPRNELHRNVFELIEEERNG